MTRTIKQDIVNSFGGLKVGKRATCTDKELTRVSSFSHYFIYISHIFSVSKTANKK